MRVYRSLPFGKYDISGTIVRLYHSCLDHISLVYLFHDIKIRIIAQISNFDDSLRIIF